VKIADSYQISIIPFGLGSSLEGHVIPTGPTITINFSLMNQILEVKEKDFLIKVQPGITRSQLNKELKKYVMFLPLDTGVDESSGVMPATNASGILSVKYGRMRDNVVDMEVVLADDTVINNRSLASK